MKTDLKYEDYKKYEVFYSGKKEFDDSFKKFGNSFSHRFCFENGYGASVIKHYGSYGYEDNLFELAVLFYDKNGSSISYNTDITDDVIGYLTNEQVLELLERIKDLDKNGRKKCMKY